MQLSALDVRRNRQWRYHLAICCLLIAVLSFFTADQVLADGISSASSRQQAIEVAQQQNGGQGKVLSVIETSDQNGKAVFAVKILSDGRVRVFRIKKSQ